MNCERVEERLSAYLDNMLASDERREITVHLPSCPRCRRSLDELWQNEILLSQLPRLSPPSSLRERIFFSEEMQQLLSSTVRLSAN